MCQRLLLPLVVATLLLVTAVRADEDESMSMDDVIQALDSFASNCDPVPTREQMEAVVMNERNPPTASKCFRYCLMLQFELIKAGSTTLEKEKMKDLIDMVMPDNEALAEEIIDKCIQKTAAITDNCDAAHELSMCVYDELKANGVKIPEIKQ